MRATEGIAPAEALEWLQAGADAIRETVFTHGDYCLPNVMIQGGRLSGLLDWGNAGLADPHRDFMAVIESIAFNLGPNWVGRFFGAYGSPGPDPERIRYYRILDKFFEFYKPSESPQGEIATAVTDCRSTSCGRGSRSSGRVRPLPGS